MILTVNYSTHDCHTNKYRYFFPFVPLCRYAILRGTLEKGRQQAVATPGFYVALLQLSAEKKHW
jgi:hypothetical protein